MALPQLDDDVVRQAQRGDQDAFALIVRTYQVPVFNHVLRLIGERGLAEDLTQEVFLRVHQSLPRFSFRSKFTTWLFQITGNRVVDEVRARARRPRAAEFPVDDRLHAADRPAEEAETIAAIWRAVAGLTLDLKTALLLRDVAGFSYNEIAETEHTTLTTVKWRIYKAREDVQSALAHEGITVTSGVRERPAKLAASA